MKSPTLEAQQKKARKELKRIWNSKSVISNKCPHCEYTCKTRGWVNGVVQHLRFNHSDKFTPTSLYERLEAGLDSQIEAAFEAGREAEKRTVNRLVDFYVQRHGASIPNELAALALKVITSQKE